jgi:hypothetical protein
MFHLPFRTLLNVTYYYYYYYCCCCCYYYYYYYYSSLGFLTIINMLFLQSWKIMNYLKGVTPVRHPCLIYLQFWLGGRTCVIEWYSGCHLWYFGSCSSSYLHVIVTAVIKWVSNSYCSSGTASGSWKEGTSSCMCNPWWHSWSGRCQCFITWSYVMNYNFHYFLFYCLVLVIAGN